MRTVAAVLVFAFAPLTAFGDDAFEKSVRPVLVKHCVKCHGPEKQRGGLRLDTKEGWKTGGDSGPAVTPGKPETSPLVTAVRWTDKNLRMPPGGKLAAHEIAALVEWVKRGAPDPRDSPARLAGMTLSEARNWWSFQPVKRPAVPRLPARTVTSASTPVDAFILARLAERGLTLSPPADRRTLLRRATYDLTGLPPGPEEVEAFVKDKSPDAFAKVVDRLLASPAYGERWGRHWLDLVRYADTAGENSDHPLPHAWRYRNGVIDSFNRDQPYDELLRDHLAGDILAAQGPPALYARRVVATGFLALARRFGHDIDKDMHLTHEDVIDTVGKAFLGLTVGCARCHDHKYDPVTAKDYYALYGIFDSTKFSFPGCEPKQQPRDLVPLLPQAEWDRMVKPYRDRLARADAQITALRAEQVKASRGLKAAAAKRRAVLAKGEVPDGGEKAIRDIPDVEVRAGEVLQLSVTPLANHGADSTLVEWAIAEVGGKGRRWELTRDVADDFLAGNPHADRHGHKATWWFLDARDGLLPLPESLRDLNGKPGLHVWRNGDTPSVFVNASREPIAVWTKLPPHTVFVHPAQNGNVAIGWLSPISGKVRITGRIKDAHSGGPDGVGWLLERLPAEVGAGLSSLEASARKLRELERQRAELVRSAPKQDVAFAVTEGMPQDAKVHLRGDPEKLGPAVPRRWLELFGGQAVPAKGGSGRLHLAGWIASKDNPLTARVMANRIWLHHFGKGIVQTPNDFGSRGLPPTHPDLLDWLASQFVESGWSIKALHRHIMLSAAYQQASAMRADAARADPNNDRYWRFDRRRLSAEELRDTLLAVSGRLDRTAAGAHPFPPEASWNFTQHVPFSTFYETDKRSVYLVSLRNRRHPFLGLFDGADANGTTPQRQATTVPTQALYFMNDPFFHAQSERLATRALAETGDSARLSELYRLGLQRAPAGKDRELSAAFLNRYGRLLADTPPAVREKTAWAALARILLASNELLYLE